MVLLLVVMRLAVVEEVLVGKVRMLRDVVPEGDLLWSPGLVLGQVVVVNRQRRRRRERGRGRRRWKWPAILGMRTGWRVGVAPSSS